MDLSVAAPSPCSPWILHLVLDRLMLSLFCQDLVRRNGEDHHAAFLSQHIVDNDSPCNRLSSTVQGDPRCTPPGLDRLDELHHRHTSFQHRHFPHLQEVPTRISWRCGRADIPPKIAASPKNIPASTREYIRPKP